MLKNSPQKKWKRSRFGTYSGWKKSCTNWWFIPYIYIYTRIYIYIFVGFQQVSKIQSAGFLPSVGVRFAFWQPRNLASRPEIRHENLRCSVVHIRKTGGYQRQGSELSQVGDILRVRFLFSSILQPSDDSHLMSLLLLLCIHFFFWWFPRVVTRMSGQACYECSWWRHGGSLGGTASLMTWQVQQVHINGDAKTPDCCGTRVS